MTALSCVWMADLWRMPKRCRSQMQDQVQMLALLAMHGWLDVSMSNSLVVRGGWVIHDATLIHNIEHAWGSVGAPG